MEGVAEGERGEVRDRGRGLPRPGRGDRAAGADRAAGRAAGPDARQAAARGVLPVPGPDRAGVRRGGPRAGREAGHPGRRRRDRRRSGRGRGPGPGNRRPGPGGRATAGRCLSLRRGRPAGGSDGRHGGQHAAPDRQRGRAGFAGPQAGVAGPAAGPGHPAGGPVPAAPGHREPAAGHRHADHPGRARAGPRRGASLPAGAGARLQHLLRPGPGRFRPGGRRAGRGRADPGTSRPPGAGHAGPAAGRRHGDPGQAGRRVRGRVQVRRHAGPGAPDRRRGDRAVHPAAGAGQRPVPGRGGGPGRRAGPGRGDRRGRGRRVRRGHRRAAPVRRGHVPAAQVRHRRGGAGRAGRPVLLRAALRGRPGPDPAAVPGAAGRPGRGDHPLGPAAADHREFGARPGRAGRGVRAGHHRRLRGADVQVGEPGFRLPGRQPRLAVDQAQARLPHRAVRHR